MPPLRFALCEVQPSRVHLTAADVSAALSPLIVFDVDESSSSSSSAFGTSPNDNATATARDDTVTSHRFPSATTRISIGERRDVAG
ncbi:unnamed protein product [Lampetra fluviatilis]